MPGCIDGCMDAKTGGFFRSDYDGLCILCSSQQMFRRLLCLQVSPRPILQDNRHTVGVTLRIVRTNFKQVILISLLPGLPSRFDPKSGSL